MYRVGNGMEWEISSDNLCFVCFVVVGVVVCFAVYL